MNLIRLRRTQLLISSKTSLIIAANRGPLHSDTARGWQPACAAWHRRAVTALTGLARYADVTWIACARTETDATWRTGTVPLDAGELHIDFLSPEAAAYDGYYHSIANPLLWFLQHSMWDVSRAPIIDRRTWHAWDTGYVVVNRLFATAIVERIRAPRRQTMVMLQDYHLYLTARGIRDQIRTRRGATASLRSCPVARSGLLAHPAGHDAPSHPRQPVRG